MNDKIYLSRSFVEFGPFSATEIKDFYKRGLLQDTDYLSGAANSWIHVNEWAASLTTASAPAAAKPAPAKKAATKAAAPAPAKKAAVKKAKK